MKPVFDSYSAYYNLLYRDKNYPAEVAYINKLLKKFGENISDILEFGSGTGIHGRLLAELGYQVTGIELSAEMVARATPAKGFTCQQGDIRQVRLNKKFDAVLSLFHVMSYQISNNDIKAALQSAAAHLSPGGIFIFDVWYTPAVYSQRPEVRTKSFADHEFKVTRLATPKIYPNENRVDVHYKVTAEELATKHQHTFDETHSMRHFSLPEIDVLAELAGFKQIHTEEFLSSAEPSENTWGVCFVLRRT